MHSTDLTITVMQHQKLIGEMYMNQKSHKPTTESLPASTKKHSKVLMTHLPSKPNHNEAEEGRILQLIQQYQAQRKQLPVSSATPSSPPAKTAPFQPVPVGGLTPPPPIKQ